MHKMKNLMLTVLGLVFLAYGEEAGTQSAFRDVSGDRARHVVVAQGTPETYNGHATLVRTKSGRMITVWTIGHGGPCGPAAESLDGGKTWTRIDDRFPAEWKNTRNCPAIFALEGNDGKERLFVFAQGRPDKANGRCIEMRHCVSEDDGLTWRMLPNAIPVTCVMPLTTIIRCADGSYLGMYNDRWPEFRKKWNRVYQIRSTDGGFTWSAPGELVAESEKMNLCEPFLLRSDDGKELCAILRDNCRDALSKMVFSRDEGKTWTAPVDTAPALSGHRHAGVKDSTGRWTIVSRNYEPNAPYKFNYCAWRGTYADIVNRRRGETVKLLHSYAKGDCGYGACVLMPDDTVFALTYIKYNPGPEKHSIVGLWLPK